MEDGPRARLISVVLAGLLILGGSGCAAPAAPAPSSEAASSTVTVSAQPNATSTASDKERYIAAFPECASPLTQEHLLTDPDLKQRVEYGMDFIQACEHKASPGHSTYYFSMLSHDQLENQPGKWTARVGVWQSDQPKPVLSPSFSVDDSDALRAIRLEQKGTDLLLRVSLQDHAGKQTEKIFNASLNSFEVTP